MSNIVFLGSNAYGHFKLTLSVVREWVQLGEQARLSKLIQRLKSVYPQFQRLFTAL